MNQNIQDKKEKRRAYMREYMMTYNLRKANGRPTARPKLTPEERQANLKHSQREYYLKNRERIIKRKRKYDTANKLKKLELRITLLKGLLEEPEQTEQTEQTETPKQPEREHNSRRTSETQPEQQEQ